MQESARADGGTPQSAPRTAPLVWEPEIPGWSSADGRKGRPYAKLPQHAVGIAHWAVRVHHGTTVGSTKLGGVRLDPHAFNVTQR